MLATYAPQSGVGKDKHEREKPNLSDNNIGKNKNKKTVINQLNGDVSSNNDGTRLLEGDILPSSVKRTYLWSFILKLFRPFEIFFSEKHVF